MSDLKRSIKRAVRAPRIRNRDKELIATLITVAAAAMVGFVTGLHITPWQGFWLLTMIYANRAQARYSERARHESR